MKVFRLAFIFIFFLSLVVCGVLFGIQNEEYVVLSFFQYETLPLPLWAVIVTAFCLGAFTAIIYASGELIRLTRQCKQLKNNPPSNTSYPPPTSYTSSYSDTSGSDDTSTSSSSSYGSTFGSIED